MTYVPSTSIRLFLNSQLFLSEFGFHPHASGEFGSESGLIFLSLLSRVKKINRNESDKVWTANLDICESDCVAKSCPVCYRTINQYGGTTCRPSFFRVNPDTIGCAWTGEFDLNTLRVEGEIFESGKKKLRISKYSDGVDGVLERSTFTWYSRNDILNTEFRL